MKRQASSAKLSNRSYASCMALSPYDKNYRGCLRADQRELIFEHQRVAKMPRRDLEDLYINLCDDHYSLKREHRFNQEKIKRLLTKILRLSSLSLSDLRANLNPNLVNKAREALSFEERLQICIFDLEIQNSQLRERLQVLCKRHGLPPPSRPVSEMYTNPFNLSDLQSNRARSYHHIDRLGHSMEEPHSATQLQIQQPLPVDTIPVKLEDNQVEERQKKIKELEEKNEQLGRLLAEFNEELEKERNHNKDLSYKLKELEIRKHISENIELIHLKEKLDQTKTELRKRIEMLETTKEKNERNLQDEQKKLVEITQKLKDEEEKAEKLLQQGKQIDGLKRQIKDLREQLIESDSEKQSLKTQQERFALLLKESVHQGDRIQVLKDKNSFLQSQLDEAKTNEMAVLHSKSELVEKIIHIQNENDRISIELEGLKSRSKFLNQENEYLTTKVSTLKRIESKKDDDEDKKSNTSPLTTNAVSRNKQSPKVNAKVSPSSKSQLKTVGVNTEPISILKDQNRYFTMQSDCSSSEQNKDDLPSENSFTMDSEVSNMKIPQARFKESPKRGTFKKSAQTNHLELLERAALYRPYSGSEYQKLPFDLPETEYSITESISVDYGLSITEPATTIDSPTITLHLKKFHFESSPREGFSYHIELTMCPGSSFKTPTKRPRNGSVSFDVQHPIQVNGLLMQSIKNSENAIRFLLIERRPSTKKSPEIGNQSSSTSAHDDTFTDIVQCQEIAFGSLKYASLIKSMSIDTIGSARKCVEPFEVPFCGTQFAHPEIGRLTLRCMIDDVERIRQLLTNTKPSSV